jgi:hypothetical protein
MENENSIMPAWAASGPQDNPYLPNLLSLASTNYAKQTDWFLHHRESGIRNLGAILFAESTLMSFYKSSSGLPMPVFVAVLVMLGSAAPAFTWLAVRSCRRSFGAAMENALMMAKVAWAMGAARIVIARQCGDRFPAASDESLYVPRWLDDCHASPTTQAFREDHLKSLNNTYGMTKIVLIMLGVGATGIGLLCAAFVLKVF